jgi:hypothetical protein
MIVVYICGLLINMVGRQNTGTSRRKRILMTMVRGILKFVVDLPFTSPLLCTCFTAMINLCNVLACSDIVHDR